MRTAVLAFTENGGRLASKIVDSMRERGHDCTGYIYSSFDIDGFVKFGSLSEITELLFKSYSALVFVSACGIAVRAAAPYIKNKTIDPAIVAADESGRFVIPLLGGHIGGANMLAAEIAGLIGATAVITTATDINNKFAVDMFAVNNDLYISDMNIAKEISAEILRGKKIGFHSDIEYDSLPAELTKDIKAPLGINVSYNTHDKPFAKTLNLVPKNIILGIGCRKDIDTATFENTVNGVLAELGVPFDAINSIATIDIKRSEPAITVFCDMHNMKAEFFTANALASVDGDFSASEFVKNVVGVDNVCERSAVCASGGSLIFRKRVANGITIAAAAKNIKLNFE